MPGTAGFIAELHTLIGGFQRWGWVMLLLSVGVLISAAYAIRTVGRLFTGPVRPQMRQVADLRGSEMAAASVLTAAILLLGVFPAPVLRLSQATLASIGAAFGPAL